MAEVPDQPKTGIWPGLKSLVSNFASSLPWRTLIGFVIFVAVLLFLVRPFEPPRELPEDNATLAWSAAVERLGMEPLYPPQEDFLVGDIYISLADPETDIAGEEVRFPSHVFRGRGVRIARIDLRKSISKGTGPYRFAHTRIPVEEKHFEGNRPLSLCTYKNTGRPSGFKSEESGELDSIGRPRYH